MYIISASGVEVNPEKVRAVERMKEPSSLKDARACLGPLGYFLLSISGFGETADSPYGLLNKSNKFERSTDCKSAVIELKKKFLEAPVLRYPNDWDPYTLTADASLTGIVANLTQKKERRIELLHMIATL